MIRDRIKEFRRVRADQLHAHPKNWRTHPANQRAALGGLLGEIGLADAVIARELPDGNLQLIDGHLRAEITGDALLPVLIVDLDEQEAEKLLLAHDAIASLAQIDRQNLDELLGGVETHAAALQTLFDDLSAQAESLVEPPSTNQLPTSPPPEIEVPRLWQVVAECTDENQQREVYEQLVAVGCKCRLLSL
jgi:hypothetical protein